MSDLDTYEPKSLAAAVQILLDTLPREYLEHLAQAEETSLAEYHMTLGTQIRNSFGLWGGNVTLLKSLGDSLDADEASMLIIKAAWDLLQARRTRH